MKIFYTYILYSTKFNKHYYGHTSDLDKRLEEHNSGLSRYTKSYSPWEIIYSEVFPTRSEAMKREIFFKCIAGYHWLKENQII